MEKKQELTMYITNLLVETLPKSQRTGEVLKKLNIREKDRFIAAQMLLSRSLKNIINNNSDEEAVSWKNEFHELVQTKLSDRYSDVLCLLNLQPIIRTVIIKINPDTREEEVKLRLSQAFKRLNDTLHERYGTKLIGCYGLVVEDFFSLGKSYKKAREIQESHYIIGVGKCTFFDIEESEQAISLIEYKHLHFFEELLQKEDWLSLEELSETIKTSVLKNRINDSKTMYVYKEIFSITIRYLFNEPDKYKEEIESLNRGIIKFEHLFDDVYEIHQYYMKVFNRIKEVELYEHINPYIKKTVKIIHSQYNEQISLTYIADKLQISIEYLSRLFKEEMECNFKKYLTYIRMQKARELLVSSHKNIKQIGEEVGYVSSTQFVRAFKVSEGVTPSKFRKYSQ